MKIIVGKLARSCYVLAILAIATGVAILFTLSPSHPLTLSSLQAGEKPADGRKLEYNRDVRPILADNCFKCHGPDSAARKAELRLDQREVAVAKGAIVPGMPTESGVVHRIFSDDAEEQMPPPSSHKKLTAAQKDLLKRWVAEGARDSEAATKEPAWESGWVRSAAIWQSWGRA